MAKTKVLFSCTQNSARSQMAEGFLRTHGGELFEVYSAGCNPTTEIHPYTVQVMDQVGIDIRDQYPKDITQLMGRMHFGYVITVCARAERDCPTVFPGMGVKLSWLFDDPRGSTVPEEEQLERFREIRDEVEAKILRWLEHPEEELAKLKAERERERQARIRAAQQQAAARNHCTLADSEEGQVSRRELLMQT